MNILPVNILLTTSLIIIILGRIAHIQAIKLKKNGDYEKAYGSISNCATGLGIAFMPILVAIMMLK